MNTKTNTIKLLLLIVYSTVIFSVYSQDSTIIKFTSPSAAIQNSDTQIFFDTDQGRKLFKQYILKNIKYPVSARKAKIVGKLFVCFRINNQGKVSNVLIKNGLFPELDNEVIRVVSSLPNYDWLDGNPSNHQTEIDRCMPIIFK